MIDFLKYWQERVDLPMKSLLSWTSMPKDKYYDWQGRYGKANEHNASIPRDHWLLEEEKQKIIDFHLEHPLNGYRRLCYMMNDANVLAVSPTTVRNVLRAAGLTDKRSHSPSMKGNGFVQPNGPHKHWHVDVTYINIAGTFFYMTSVLDGYSRMIVHWEIGEKMQTSDIELIIERAKEKSGARRPRIISDNGPQFIGYEFKKYIRLTGMSHVRTSPYYPQSNGKIEAMHKSLKKECIRPKAPKSLKEAQRHVTQFVDHYNNVRLHSGLGYVSPATKLAGKEREVFKLREERLEAARENRRKLRREARERLLRSEAETVLGAESSLSGATSRVLELRLDSCSDDVITSGNLQSARAE